MKRLTGACIAFALLSALAPYVALLPGETWGSAIIALHFALLAASVVATVGYTPTPKATRWVLGAAAVAYCAAALSPPFTSNDVYRYLWDGHSVLSGVDPWKTRPLASSITDWPAPPDNRGIASLYPPGAMAVFALAALAGPSLGLWVWKLIVLGAALAVVFLVSQQLRGTAQARWLPLVALCPLLVIEAGVGAHLDVLSALSLVLALRALRRGAFVTAGVFLGTGGLLKLLPLAALLPVAAAFGLRAGSRAALGALATLAGGYALALGFGLAPLGSLAQFMGQWRFGTPVALVDRLAGAGPALLTSAVLFTALCAWSFVRARRAGAEAGLAFALAAPLVASPVAFPWYLAPLAATTATGPTALSLTWVALAPLTYEVVGTYQRSGEFTPALWPLWVSFAALAVAALVDLLGPLRKLEAPNP